MTGENIKILSDHGIFPLPCPVSCEHSRQIAKEIGDLIDKIAKLQKQNDKLILYISCAHAWIAGSGGNDDLTRFHKHMAKMGILLENEND